MILFPQVLMTWLFLHKEPNLYPGYLLFLFLSLQLFFVIKSIPTIISINEDNSFHTSTCPSLKNIRANTTPNTDDVEKTITDFTVPISFIPLKKRKREPANPPKLKKKRMGIW